MKKYFKTNESYFKFLDVNKDKIDNIKVTIKPKSVKVEYDSLTQLKKKVNK